MTALILASASPRRRELLAQLGVAFEVMAADVDETPHPGEAATDLVRRLAVAKADAAVAASRALDRRRPIVVLAADTVVAVEGEVLGKPVDDADAARMLRVLSGTRHQVLTGVAVVASSDMAASIDVDVAITEVHMAELSQDDIADYVATGDPLDKAGSYAIQEVGDRFVRSITGGFDNVVGLPLDLVRRMLVDAGIDL